MSLIASKADMYTLAARAYDMTDKIEPPFKDQQFTSHQEWVNKATSWLTRHPLYCNTEHGETKGWRGKHFTAMCFDSFGRRCRNGADFSRAKEELAFPIWWVWPDQIVDLVVMAKLSQSE